MKKGEQDLERGEEVGRKEEWYRLDGHQYLEGKLSDRPANYQF